MIIFFAIIKFITPDISPRPHSSSVLFYSNDQELEHLPKRMVKKKFARAKT